MASYVKDLFKKGFTDHVKKEVGKKLRVEDFAPDEDLPERRRFDMDANDAPTREEVRQTSRFKLAIIVVIFVLAVWFVQRSWGNEKHKAVPRMHFDSMLSTRYPRWRVVIMVKRSSQMLSAREAVRLLHQTERQTEPVQALKEKSSGVFRVAIAIPKSTEQQCRRAWRNPRAPVQAVPWQAGRPWREHAAMAASIIEGEQPDDVIVVMDASVLSLNMGWRSALAMALSRTSSFTVVAASLQPMLDRKKDRAGRYCPNRFGKMEPVGPDARASEVFFCPGPFSMKPDIGAATRHTWQRIRDGGESNMRWTSDILGTKM